MSSGEVRRVSRQDIQLVQNLIERCLQLYMNQKEVVDTLLVQARIEPGFTELVWQKLEEENRDFFKAYHVRLMLKNQIMIFNKLLEQQVELMRKKNPAGVSLPVSNGSHASTFHQNPHYVEEQRVTRSRLDDMHHSVDPSSALRNGRPSMLRSTHTADDASAHDGSMDLSVNMLLTQNSEMGMLQAMNGMAIKSEPGYSNSSSFVYGATDGNVLETHSTIGEASITSFSSTESNSQTLNESSLDANFGFLRQIPRTFSLSDLTADFCQSSDIMENYSRSPFLDADDFPDSPGRECQGENKRLDTISESLSYEDFGSD
ncbi:uncharacterized protein LOC131227910 isoform X2 [Magnolia sinica]|uniref:uncharacterized protein LOC131227910 isoform X2 n=1 Tax=Magnolia sinica TaxID=86752 RepID=UPI0026594581|nr:uncharacterized protein LOC131227910 isoform X2 [Magnolia sinica]